MDTEGMEEVKKSNPPPASKPDEELDNLIIKIRQPVHTVAGDNEAKAQLLAWRDSGIAEANNLLADIVKKAVPYGTQDGDFVANYIIPTGPIHRAIPYLDSQGIARAELKPEPLNKEDV